jgi:hypothetical protein
LSEKELYPSEFAILTAKNVDDISKMIFSVTSSHNASAFGESSPQSTALNFLRSFSPSFTALDGAVKAAIPIPSGTPAGDYEISIAFGAEKQLFTLTVKDAASPEKAVIGKPFADLSANVSTSAVSGFHTVLKNVPTSNQSLILFRSAFLSPLENGFSSGYEYENTVSATDKEDVFVSIGNEYLSSTVGGSSVPALNSGIVAAVGYSAHLGNYVSVDHGLGIRTWYCCLSSIDVELGDALAKGESVGKCGTKGLVSASGTVILCSVYDCLIDPDFIIGKEIKH